MRISESRKNHRKNSGKLQTNRAIVESIEQRIFLSAASYTGISSIMTDVASNGTFTQTQSVFGEVSGVPGNGHSLHNQFMVYEFDSPDNLIFPSPAQFTSITGVNVQLWDNGESTTGNFAASAGGFNVYLIPNTTSTTPTSTLRFNTTGDVSGLTGQGGVNDDTTYLLGTVNFSTPPTTGQYLSFTASSLSASAQSVLLNDLNSGIAFRIAVTPNTTTTGADDLTGNINGNVSSTFTITGTQTATENFAFSNTSYSVNETAGTAYLSVVRTGDSSDSASVIYTTSNGSALAGTNYTATTGTVTFAAGQNIATASIPITNDLSQSSNQSFTVTLSSPTDANGDSGDSVGAAATETIVASSPLTNNLSSTVTSATDIEVSGTFSSAYAPINGDTTAGTGSFNYLSYEVLEVSPTGSPGLYPTLGQTVNSVSNLSLQMYNTATTGNYAGISGNFDVYFIPNTDSATATSSLKYLFSDPSGLFNPNGVGQAGVTSGTLLGTLSFNGNALGYDTFTPSAALPGSVASAIVADLNGGSNFRLAVTPQTYGVGAVAADWSGVFTGETPIVSLSASVTQVEQPEFISFSSANYSVNETAGTETINLTRTGFTGDQATVQYATADGSALAGTNYTATSGTATFLANSASAQFTVPITDVTPQGGNKQLSLSLSNAVAANNTTTASIAGLVSPSTAVLTIVDSANDGTNTTTLTQYASDTSDVETAGPFTNTLFKIEGNNAGGFTSYAVADFNNASVTGPNGADSYTVPNGTEVTAINSLTLEVYNGPVGKNGNLDVYLVSDAASNIDPGTPQSKNPHFFDTTTADLPEGLDASDSFGTKTLLGTVVWNGSAATTSVINIPLIDMSSSAEATLVSDLNTGTKFRLVATPEKDNGVTGTATTSTVYADIEGEVAAANSVYLAPQLAINVTDKIITGTTLHNNGSSTSNALQTLSFTATVSGGVPDGSTVLLEDASNGNAVVGSGVTTSGSANISVAAGTILAGTHQLFAVYAGNNDFLGSQSAQQAQTVQVVFETPVVNGNIPALVGVQRSMVDSILYTFSEAVNITGASAVTLVVHSGQTGTVPTVGLSAVNPNLDGSSNQWQVTFSGAGVVGNSIGNGVYDISINAADVTSDFDPAVAAQPRSTDTFYRLFGDYLGTENVSTTDYSDFLGTFGLRSGQTGFLAAFDSDGNGRIQTADFTAFLSDFGLRYRGFTATI